MPTVKNIKTLSAVIGASALTVMTIVAVNVDRDATGTVSASSMTLGQTTTSTTPPTTPAVPLAKPALKAARPTGF